MRSFVAALEPDTRVGTDFGFVHGDFVVTSHVDFFAVGVAVVVDGGVFCGGGRWRGEEVLAILE